MGGNTKITIEMARCLAGEIDVHVFLPEYKLPTFTANLPGASGIKFHTFTDFPGNDKTRPFASSRWYRPFVDRLFKELSVGADDLVFSCSDFHIDVLPIAPMQKKYGFKWIPSVFLFVPFITENLAQGYRFPAFKYLIYWVYQRWLFGIMKRRAFAFVVTNKSDFAKFPKRFDGRLFAYYGGVNPEQIPDLSGTEKEYDAIYCSRLHPQKGLDAFLDVWKLVLASKPDAKFAIIGNGEPAYEQYLKDKAVRLGINESINWLGYVNNEAKFKLYSRAKCLVHPTVFDNNGMVAAEALCTGLPVIMQDLPALRDVYTTGCTKVPFGDRNAFAGAILKVLSDPGTYAPAGDQIKSLRAHWCWESRAAEFKEWLGTISGR